uniref:Uncharacterized protein n=1 Tax=viral metagenome TaxID=1070528 RepID=A0A6H1ZAB4_9ZZZZ
MNIEPRVTSLKLSNELKKNGYPQEGLWFYNSETMKLQRGFTSHTTQEGIMKWSIVAPTCDELGEKLPLGFDIRKANGSKEASWYCLFTIDFEHGQKEDFLFYADTEANVRAKMWLYLKKHGVIK